MVGLERLETVVQLEAGDVGAAPELPALSPGRGPQHRQAGRGPCAFAPLSAEDVERKPPVNVQLVPPSRDSLSKLSASVDRRIGWVLK